MTTVARITPVEGGGFALLCLMEGCEFGRGFDTMEALEFILQKHFKNKHKVSVRMQRVGDKDGQTVEIPE